MERDRYGGAVRMVGTHLDISARKKSEAALETLITEQNAMLQNESIGIARVKDSRFVWVNQRYEQMLGYGPDELIGLPTSALFIDQQAYAVFSQDCHPAMNSGKPYRAQLKQRRKDGAEIWIDLSCTIINGDSNELIGVMIDVSEQKKAEEARQQALRQINTIAAQVPGAMFQFCRKPDGSFSFPYASAGIQELFRLSPEQVQQDASKIFAALHPDDHDEIINLIAQSANNLMPIYHEYRVKFADGEIRWHYGNARPVKQEDESVLWHGFLTDVTERKQMDALYYQNKMRHALIVVCAELGTWDWDLASGRLILNEHWAKMRGHRFDVLEQSLAEWQASIHPDDLAKVQSAFADHFNNEGGLFQIEYRALTKDGKTIWVLNRGATVEHAADGKPLRMVGTEMDITDRKLAEQNLKINQERLFYALQGANDGLWDWNFKTQAVYFSPRWKSMLGYQDNELANRFDTWANLVDPAQKENALQKVRDYVEGKLSVYEVEFRMRHKDGHWVDILSRAKLAVDSDGNLLTPLRLVGTHVDISERKNQERQRLVQEEKQRYTLIREVHHRIKNNIQGISGILRQFALVHPETTEPIRQAVSQMQSIAVIYGLQGQRLGDSGSVRVAELISAIANNIESLWNRSIQLDSASDDPVYNIAETETVPLALVINELLSNAVKHSGQHEVVNVILRAKLSPESISLAIHNKGQLPAGFDFNQQSGLNTGLNLVKSLLPRKHVCLRYEQREGSVLAILEIQPPVVKLCLFH